MLDVILEETGVAGTGTITKVSILLVLDVILEGSIILMVTRYEKSFNPSCAGCDSGRLMF